jgi:gas vesicle protein
MNKNEKIIAGILIGAAAGIAAAIFLETEKGKKLLADIKEMASDTIDDALGRLATIEEKLKEKLIISDTDEDATLS